MTSQTNIRDKLKQIYILLLKRYGAPRCFLQYKTPFELLVMAVLSAQCTDAKVNAIAPVIFAKYPDANSLANANFEEFSSLIRPLGLYKAKARNLIATAKILVEKYNGNVPPSMEELIHLPGIGRKTANVILGHAFGLPGFPVDTHVQRVLKRVGIAKEKDNPLKIEKVINENLPKDCWSNFSLLLISHGRTICKPRTPICQSCEIRKYCVYSRKELKS